MLLLTTCQQIQNFVKLIYLKYFNQVDLVGSLVGNLDKKKTLKNFVILLARHSLPR